MKKLFLALSFCLLSLVSCNKDKNTSKEDKYKIEDVEQTINDIDWNTPR